jgi:hypothetical protein
MLYIKKHKKHKIINLPTRIQLFLIKIKNRNLVSRNHNFFLVLYKNLKMYVFFDITFLQKVFLILLFYKKYF